MLAQALAIARGKGGVGGTSTAGALAGLFAQAGRRVLAVDMDPQGNLGRDLGYFEEVEAAGTGGKALLGGVHGYPVEPIRDVRPRLDCLSAGNATEELFDVFWSRERRGPGAAMTAIQDALAPIASNYDLIIFDCPPGVPLTQRVVLSCAQHVLIPTKTDDASLDGIPKLDEAVALVKSQTNPSLHLIGSFIFGVGVKSTQIEARARQAIADCLGPEYVLDARIRHAEGAASDVRRLGLLPHELEAQLPEAKRARLAALRERRTSGVHRPEAVEARLSGSASGLAEDYEKLSKEVAARIKQYRQSAAARRGA